jgi:hypothetical protein
MSRDIGHRFHSAAELRDALKALLPDGARLTQAEIGPPAEAERQSIAPRLSLADTVMLRPTFRPKNSLSPHSRAERRFNRASIALAALVIVLGTGAWKFARQARIGTPLAAATPAAVITVPPVTTAPSSTPASVPVRFQLEVEPANAAVLVDGAPRQPQDGKLELAGPLGSIHLVRLTLSGRSIEERVAITADGLMPPTIVLAMPSTHKTKTDSASHSVAGAKSQASASETANAVDPAATTTQEPNLSPDFK